MTRARRAAGLLAALLLLACAPDPAGAPQATSVEVAASAPPASAAPSAAAPGADLASAPTPEPPPKTCAPQGEAPPAWSAPTLAEAERIPLDAGWEVLLDPRRMSATAPWPEDGALPLQTPGFTPLPATKRRHTAWARLSFDVPEDADLDALALDLGGRQGITTVWLNGKRLDPNKVKHHPLLLPAPKGLKRGANELRLELEISSFAAGVVWYGAPALGTPDTARRGRVERRFTSKVDGSEQTVMAYLPRCADLTRPLPLIVALPGWGGNHSAYAGSSLLALAEERGALVLVPDPRGDRLYIDQAEDGVLEAIALAQAELPVDPDRIILMGLSMGGAGALQIGYHYPDRFAALVSWYGDSRYDMSTYVKGILKTRQKADQYSVLHVAGNARSTPVFLIHAHDDAVSPVEQSLWLFEASQRLRFTHHRLADPPTGGHTFAVLEDYMSEAVDFSLDTRRATRPPRVSFRTNSWRYVEAWWLDVVLAREGEFGRADLSFDAAEARLTVHTVDEGLEAARVHADALELPRRAPIKLQIEEPLAGALVIARLGAITQVRLWRDDPAKATLIPVHAGSARLPALAPGAWQLDFPEATP